MEANGMTMEQLKSQLTRTEAERDLYRGALEQAEKWNDYARNSEGEKTPNEFLQKMFDNEEIVKPVRHICAMILLMREALTAGSKIRSSGEEEER